jgi:hypothetical protein
MNSPIVNEESEIKNTIIIYIGIKSDVLYSTWFSILFFIFLYKKHPYINVVINIKIK